LVKQCDRHAALADRRRDTLDRTQAHVAACEYAGNARSCRVAIGTDEFEEASTVMPADGSAVSVVNVGCRQMAVTVDRANFRP
jgi:hypothetical protein